MLDEAKMQRTLLHVLHRLMTRQYEALSAFSATKVMTPELLRQAIEEWPEKEHPDRFVMPPTDDITQLVMEGGLDPIPNIMPEIWMLEVYLWTLEQGQSDLSLRLTLIDAPKELYQVEVNDILVM